METKRDEDGQPLNRGLHHQRLVGRSADELIGICKGILADGAVVDGEAEFLLQWMEANRQYLDRWPFDHLYARVATFMLDGRLDEAEECELVQLLADLGGPGGVALGENPACESLCDRPAPQINFAGSVFCVTGKFVSMKRPDIELLILDRGGTMKSSISRKVGYVLLGAYGSRDWLHSNCGTKLQDVAEFRKRGVVIPVVAERDLLRQVGISTS